MKRIISLILFFVTLTSYGQSPNRSYKADAYKTISGTTAEIESWTVPAGEVWRAYDTTVDQWKINYEGAGWVVDSMALGELTDVNITTPDSLDYMAYDGTSWENRKFDLGSVDGITQSGDFAYWVNEPAYDTPKDTLTSYNLREQVWTTREAYIDSTFSIGAAYLGFYRRHGLIIGAKPDRPHFTFGDYTRNYTSFTGGPRNVGVDMTMVNIDPARDSVDRRTYGRIRVNDTLGVTRATIDGLGNIDIQGEYRVNGVPISSGAWDGNAASDLNMNGFDIDVTGTNSKININGSGSQIDLINGDIILRDGPSGGGDLLFTNQDGTTTFGQIRSVGRMVMNMDLSSNDYILDPTGNTIFYSNNQGSQHFRVFADSDETGFQITFGKKAAFQDGIDITDGLLLAGADTLRLTKTKNITITDPDFTGGDVTEVILTSPGINQMWVIESVQIVANDVTATDIVYASLEYDGVVGSQASRLSVSTVGTAVDNYRVINTTTGAFDPTNAGVNLILENDTAEAITGTFNILVSYYLFKY